MPEGRLIGFRSKCTSGVWSQAEETQGVKPGTRGEPPGPRQTRVQWVWRRGCGVALSRNLEPVGPRARPRLGENGGAGLRSEAWPSLPGAPSSCSRHPGDPGAAPRASQPALQKAHAGETPGWGAGTALSPSGPGPVLLCPRGCGRHRSAGRQAGARCAPGAHGASPDPGSARLSLWGAFPGVLR